MLSSTVLSVRPQRVTARFSCAFFPFTSVVVGLWSIKSVLSLSCLNLKEGNTLVVLFFSRGVLFLEMIRNHPSRETSFYQVHGFHSESLKMLNFLGLWCAVRRFSAE